MRLDARKYIQSVKLARSILQPELKARVLSPLEEYNKERKGKQTQSKFAGARRNSICLFPIFRKQYIGYVFS